MKIVKFVICLIFGAMFINAGLNKLFNYIPTPELSEELTRINQALESVKWLLPLVGIVQIIGGILFIIPKTRALGAIMVFPIMVGIICQHICYEPIGLPFASAFALVNLWIIIDNRTKYLPLIGQ